MSGVSGRRRDADGSVAMTEHAVVIAGGGSDRAYVGGELALAGVDVGEAQVTLSKSGLWLPCV